MGKFQSWFSQKWFHIFFYFFWHVFQNFWMRDLAIWRTVSDQYIIRVDSSCFPGILSPIPIYIIIQYESNPINLFYFLVIHHKNDEMSAAVAADAAVASQQLHHSYSMCTFERALYTLIIYLGMQTYMVCLEIIRNILCSWGIHLSTKL